MYEPAFPGPLPRVRVDVVHPSELDEDARRRWRAMQRAVPGLDNPFLSPEFTVAVGRFRRSARVAVLSDGAGVVGFFPFERRRSGVGVPIAAGLTDCQGVVHAAGLDLDAKALLRACRLEVFDFDHLVAGQPFFEPFTARRAASPVMDLGGGYAAYEAHLRANSPKFLKTTLYKERKLGRDVGELRFEYDVRDHGELHRVMAWKSAQYRRTGRTDRFARPWIVGLADHLLDIDADGFSAAFSMLYAGDRAIAGHFGMRTDRVLVGWFPSYDTRYSKYSPGLAMHLQLAEAAAAAGIQCIDLGKGAREYKDSLKSCELTVGEGRVMRPSPVAFAHWAKTAPVRGVRRLVLTHPPLLRAANRALGCFGRLSKAVRPGR
jgi:CelD/BcsL family acetyltransferase involved in cellulose biosynthesis